MPKNYISNKDETIRMFENDFLESLSRVHWTVPLILFIPVILVLLYRRFYIVSIPVSESILLIIYGLVVWTFTEYTLHRCVFHNQSKSRWGKRTHFLIHGLHHNYPKDSKRLVMSPSVSLTFAAAFILLFRSVIGNVYISFFFAGFLMGYLFYLITHHSKHHYQNQNLGYRVRQPIWDHVFGTTFPAKEESRVGLKKILQAEFLISHSEE